jgi:acetylornithine/N-succinyldiaminopimelate aminotransferase
MNKEVALINNYARNSLSFTHGEGSWLYDAEGRRYLDSIAGIAVNALGHGHPVFTKAVSAQLSRLVHVSNLYTLPEQENLAQTLSQASGMNEAFFCNSGAESIEAAIKIARKFGHDNGKVEPVILVFTGGFHGRTMGALAATSNNTYQAPFGPMLSGFIRADYGNIEAVQKVFEDHTQICAVLVEPIQGEGGVVVPPAGFLSSLRKICKERNALLMLDEVQTGNGRTGEYFAYQHSKILPDVLSTAKGLGNGYPIGATLVAGLARGVIQPGNHGTTFGGSPLACAAASAVYQVLADENLVMNAAVRGEQLLNELNKGLQGCQVVNEIRGQGLLVGIELNKPCGELIEKAKELGVLINVAVQKVIRLAPPLTINSEEVDFLARIIIKLVRNFENEEK